MVNVLYFLGVITININLVFIGKIDNNGVYW